MEFSSTEVISTEKKVSFFFLKRKFQKRQVNSGLQMDLWIKWWKLSVTLERNILMTLGSGV